MACTHQWKTVFQECSGSGGMDDFFETLQNYYDAYVWYQCEICGTKENERSVKAYPSKVGYGNYETPGRLPLDELAKKLSSRK